MRRKDQAAITKINRSVIYDLPPNLKIQIPHYHQASTYYKRKSDE